MINGVKKKGKAGRFFCGKGVFFYFILFITTTYIINTDFYSTLLYSILTNKQIDVTKLHR